MSAPYLTICILCVLSGIAFLYRFVWYSRAAEKDMRTGASKTIGSREIQMDYYTIEENENGLLAVLADGMGKEAGGRIAAKTVIRVLKKFLEHITWRITLPIFSGKHFRLQTGKF